MLHWTLKRNDNSATLQLHRQYAWRDEYDWTPLAQSAPVYMFSGAMDIQQGTMQAGRPITLDSSFARISRGDLSILQGWAAVPELTLTLTHPDGRSFTVAFRRPALSDIRAIRPVRPSDEQASDLMTAHIHLMTL